MSCCSSGYCNFNFPEGPPLTDLPVANLQAKYLFLPYGTLLSKGEVIRIWMENGQTRVVSIKEKIPVVFSDAGPLTEDYEGVMPWELVAYDSGMEAEDLLLWHHHELYNPNETSIVLEFEQLEVPERTIMQILRAWLYKIRTL